MKQQVNSKLLILFGIICGTFIAAESGFCAETIANKSSTFSAQLSKSVSDSDDGDSEIATQIRAQRAAIDARESQENNAKKAKSGATSNDCDGALRKCIENKCGTSFAQCEKDSDTTFSDKLNSCKKQTSCTAHEFNLFADEIKEDKKQEIRLALYNKTLDCGNRYNDCIIGQCGPKFNKCLGKSAGDKAIAACKTIATECTEADSGLAGRVGSVFGTVRQSAEKQIKVDEQKLYSLRDKMRNSCKMLGAMFDDRSLDCVFTVNFFSGEKQDTPTASKKLYAGSLFDCTPDWFGIDVTTFKENAYRATRAQSSASAAMLGSGVGIAVGAITSGAIDRAIDTKKAKNALSDACEQNGQVMEDGKCRDMTAQEKCSGTDGVWKNNTCNCDPGKSLIKEGDVCRAMTDEERCEAKSSGGTWNGTKCDCPDRKEPENNVCVDIKNKKNCEEHITGAKWSGGKCKCELDYQKFDNDDLKKATKCINDDGTDGKFTKFKKACEDESSGGEWKETNGKFSCDCSNAKDGKTHENANTHKCVRTVGQFASDAISGIGGLFTKKSDTKGEDNTPGNTSSPQLPKTLDELYALCSMTYKGTPDTNNKTCKCPTDDGGKCEQWLQAYKKKLNYAVVAFQCSQSNGSMNVLGECRCPNGKTSKTGNC